MDVPIVMTPMQLLLIWLLLGLLLAWTICFAWLALRPEPEQRTEDLSLSSSLPSAPAPSMLHVLAAPAQQKATANSLAHESTGEVRAVQART